MGETPDDIKQEIEQARERLGREPEPARTQRQEDVGLARRISTAIPRPFLGAAFGVGVSDRLDGDPARARPHGNASIELTRPPVRRRTFHCAFSAAYCAS